MAEIGSAFLSILPSAKGFGKSLDKQVGGDVGKSGKKLGSSFGKVFAAAAAIGIGAKAFGFLSGSLAEAREAAVIGARTDNVIKKMGASAWTSSKQVGALASSLSRKVGVDDEAIQEGQNLLLTFGKIRNEAGKGNDVFDQTTKLMVDMSRAMGTDTKSAALQLGKALNDPAKGVTKLARSGVSFTKQQTEQIKALQESGDLLGAQKIILAEVEKQFGGAAKAMSTPADRAAVAWGNFKESFGTLLLPVVDRVMSRMTPLIDQMSAKLPSALRTVRAAVMPVVEVLRNALGPVLERVTGFIRENPTVVKAFAIGLGVVAAAMGVLTIATTAFSVALNSTGIPLIVIALAALVAGLILAYQRSETFRAVVQKIGEQLRVFGTWLRNVVMPAVVDLARKVAANLQPVLVAVGQVIQTRVLPLVQRAAAKFREWWPTIQRVIAVAGKLIGRFIEFQSQVAGKVLPVVVRFAGWLLSKMVPAIATGVSVIGKIIGRIAAFGSALVAGGKKMLQFSNTVGLKIREVVAFFTGLPGRIKAQVANFGSLLVDAGRELIGGLISGITEKAKDLAAPMAGLASKIKGYLPGSPVKEGPLRSWNRGGAGKRLMQLLIDGINASTGKVGKSVERVMDGIDKALKKKDISKRVAKQMRAVVAVATKEAAKLRDLIAARAGMAAEVASGLRGEFDLSAIIAPNEFGFSPSASGAVKVARGIVARMKAFAADIAALVRQGMPAALVREIAGMGSVEGGKVAKVFRSATGSEMAGLRQAYKDIGTYAQSIGNIVAGQQYNGQIAAQQKELRGVEKAIERGLGRARFDVRLDVDRGSAVRIYKLGKREDERRR